MERTFEYRITIIVDGPNEIPSDDAIDHAQTTIEDFVGGTPPEPVRRARTASEDGPRDRCMGDLRAMAEKRQFQHECGQCGAVGYNRRSCTHPTPIREIPGALHRDDSPTYHP